MKRLLPILLAALPLFAADQPITPPATPADLNTPPADAQHLPSGLVTKQLKAGTGKGHPADTDLVKIGFTVWKSDGKLLQNVPPEHPALLAMSKMLPGWREALRMMVPGEKRRAWVTPAVGGGRIPAGQALIFDTELVEIVPPPSTPADVAAPPADAKKTASGLAYKVLKAGSGTQHPTRTSTVVVHYSGWTTDGKMFDSSVMRGTPAEFPLDQVIKGWTEGVQLMVPGEKTRFWIPANLAYGNRPGMPAGMLVFDIELLSMH